MTCPFCNKEVIENAEFCPDCGQNITISPECPSCGVEILPGKKFCHKCGAPVSQKKEFPFTFPLRGKKKIVAILLPVIIIILIFINVFFGGRDEKLLSNCELNMKTIATALAMYAIDSQGTYPPSLAYCNKYLEESRLTVPPLCPACKEPYIYQKTGNIFILKCGGQNSHIKTGRVDEGHYPVYILQHGIILKGDYLSYIEISQPSATPSMTPAPEGMSELSICEENLKKIAAAIDIYGSDNNSQFPSTLEYLTTGRAMKYIPSCPSCSQVYIYERSSDDFTLKCGGVNAHLNTGEVGEGHFPAYTKKRGIIMREEMTVTSSPSVTEKPDITPAGEVMEFINENYMALEKRDFKKAYDFKSSDWKKKNTCEDYCKYWKDNITINLKNAEIIEISDGDARAKIRYYTEDKDPKSGKTEKAFYSGTIDLIRENGEWRIKNVESEKENSN